MKVRVRAPDGATLKLEADADDSVGSLIAAASKAWSSDHPTSQASTMLSLNKKTALNEDQTLRDCGVRGGDLLFLLSENVSRQPLQFACPQWYLQGNP